METAKTILVVEDEKLILSGTARLLRNAGYTVFEAETGQQALAQAKEHIPDLILLDIVLPDIDGFEVCRRLKADETTSAIYISIISGIKTKSSQQSEGLEIGADDYITRPIANRELLARVGAMFRTIMAEKELERHRNQLSMLVASRTAALDTKAEMFSTLFDQSAVGIVHVLPDGRFKRVNARFCEIVGYAPDEILNMSFRDITFPEDLPLDEDLIARVLAGDIDTFDIEKRYIHKNGQIIWVKLYSNVVRDNGGQIKYAFATVVDITEIKKNEERIKKLAKEWRTTFDATNAAMWIIDKNYRIVRSNLAGQQLFKCSEEELIGKTCWEVVHQTDQPIAECPTLLAKDSLKREMVQLQLNDRWYEITVDPIVDENNAYSRAIHIMTDITDRVRNENERDRLLSGFKQKAIEMEALFSGTKLLLDAEESFETTSRQIFDICRSLTGAKSGYVALLSDDGAENEVLFLESGGLPCGVNPELPMPIRGLRAEAYKIGKAVFDNDFSNSRWMKYMPQGHVTLKNVLFGPVKDNGKAVGLIGLANKDDDFTENDAKIVTAFGELAAISLRQSVTQKALSESEKRLHQTQKLEAIGNLAGGIAHDFNNILASILGYTELCLDDAKAGSLLQDNLNEIYIAGKRAKDLVKQILTFARQIDTEFKPIQVSRVAKEALKLLRSTIPTDIDIKSDLQSDALVLGDVTQIHQLFMNLCTNAAQVLESTGGTMHVSIYDVYLDPATVNRYKEIVPGDYIEITIADTGSGIPPDHIEHVFDPFFTTKDQGTGMGLSTAHGIVKAYNGDIYVESQLGVGTTFKLVLPITKRQSQIQSYTPEELPAGNERVLVIDDEPPIAKMASMILNRLGYQTTTRSSSLDALEYFRAHPHDFDLIVTDMTMSNLTGDKLAREVLKIRPDMPIIICTGYSNRLSDERAAEIGIKALAMKPLAKQNLAKTVRKVLDTANRKVE